MGELNQPWSHPHCAGNYSTVARDAKIAQLITEFLEKTEQYSGCFNELTTPRPEEAGGKEYRGPSNSSLGILEIFIDGVLARKRKALSQSTSIKPADSLPKS